MADRKRLIPLLLSLAISVATVVYVLSRIDLNSILLTLFKINYLWLSLAMASFIGSYILKTLRFQVLAHNQPISFNELMGITSLYGMFNYLLPIKSGELSLIILLKRYRNIAIIDGTAILVTSRFFDFFTTALILPIIIVIFNNQLPNWLEKIAILFCLLFYLGAVFLFYFLKKSINTLKNRSNNFLIRLATQWNYLNLSLQSIYKNRRYWPTFFLTIGIWLCTYTYLFFIILSLGYQPSYFQVIIISIITVPLTLLPTQGFANLGTHELGWITAFMFFGYNQEAALTIATGSHIILLLFILIMGSSGFWLFKQGMKINNS